MDHDSRKFRFPIYYRDFYGSAFIILLKNGNYDPVAFAVAITKIDFHGSAGNNDSFIPSNVVANFGGARDNSGARHLSVHNPGD